MSNSIIAIHWERVRNRRWNNPDDLIGDNVMRLKMPEVVSAYCKGIK